MRNIKETQFGWFEKGAMKKIEEMDFKKQASCKLIYIALCSLSAKSLNNAIIECYKRDIAKFASVSEKTVQRYLGELEAMDIVSIGNNGRKVGGLWEKMTITLKGNMPPKDTESKAMDSSMDSSMDTESDIYKKERKKENITKQASLEKKSKKNISTANEKKVTNHVRVVNMVVLAQGLKFDNKGEYNLFLKQNLRMATSLTKTYSLEDIAKGICFVLQQNFPDWSLSAVSKHIHKMKDIKIERKETIEAIGRLLEKSLQHNPNTK